MVELITTQTTKPCQMQLLSSYDLAYTKQAQQRNISELLWHHYLGNIVIKYSTCVINFTSKTKTIPPYRVPRNRTLLSDNRGTCGLFVFDLNSKIGVTNGIIKESVYMNESPQKAKRILHDCVEIWNISLDVQNISWVRSEQIRSLAFI
mgnify:CR=1 FL=1